MTIRVLRKEEQADGQFNGGAILEKRPVVYQSGKASAKRPKTFPYSNLFYWAHAWTENGSTIGLHPHKGFEILSFVLKGGIEHYDTKNNKWIPLSEGSVQVIRSGSGISHAEKLNPGGHIFQIWFDPNLDKSMHKPATYNDYNADVFPEESKNGMTIKTFKGVGAPIEMDTEGVQIWSMMMQKGTHEITNSKSKILSVFIIDGRLSIEGQVLNAEDFFTITDGDKVLIEALSGCTIFIIETVMRPSYATYIEGN